MLYFGKPAKEGRKDGGPREHATLDTPLVVFFREETPGSSTPLVAVEVGCLKPSYVSGGPVMAAGISNHL
jgi:hypothetical protein